MADELDVQIVQGSLMTISVAVKPLEAFLSSQQASWLVQGATDIRQLASGVQENSVSICNLQFVSKLSHEAARQPEHRKQMQ